MSERRYISCADTAKLVRQALQQSFPAIKFSVRSSTYSMGASIDVRWTDGPTASDVEKVVKQFAGGRFDGMIDLAYSVDHWLTPDGNVVVADDGGTTGSRGVREGYSNPAPSPNAERVTFGADYVFCEREYSVPFYTRIANAVAARYGFPEPEVKYHTDKKTGKAYSPHVPHDYNQMVGDRDTLTDRIYQVIQRTPVTAKEPVWYEKGFEPIRIKQQPPQQNDQEAFLTWCGIETK